MIESEQVIVRNFINYCKNHFNIEFDMEMLDLIYKTKQYIRDLAATCNASCGKVD